LIESEYVFEGPDGAASLLDLFDSRSQLIIQHFMFGPDWDAGCPSCSASADEISAGLLKHLHARDTSFVVVARAPLAKIEAYKALRLGLIVSVCCFCAAAAQVLSPAWLASILHEPAAV
jgi:hypothetical protein